MPIESAPGSRTDRRRLQTRAALLSAGRRLYSDRGVGEVTIQDITDAADVAKGSFYNHFESREDLLRVAASAALEEIGAANDLKIEERGSDAARVVAASLLSTLRTCLANPVLGGFLLKNVDLVDFGEALFVRGRRDLIRGKKSGRFVIEDLEMMMIALAGAAHSIIRARLRKDLPRASEPRFITTVLQMLGVEASEAKMISIEVNEREKSS